jgi:SAM-dependent methyltransferase
MSTPMPKTQSAYYAVPPDVYDLAVGWDPQPEVNRLLLLTRQAGVQPRSALELGCGTGRLLQALRASVLDVWGIELSPALAGFARDRGAGEIVVGDMTDLALDRAFDLIFSSANTIRHALTDTAIARMWRCIHEHLVSDGVFIADLELGFDAEAEKVGRPATWEITRSGKSVKATWLVTEPPASKTRRCKIEYTFESCGEESRGRWRESFELRTYDAPEFLKIASTCGGLKPVGIYELRDPYLIETPAGQAVGRHLVVMQRPRLR